MVQWLFPSNSVNATEPSRDRCRGDVAQAKLEKPKPPFPQCVTEPENIEAWQAGGKRPETQADGTRAGEVDVMALWHLTQAAGHSSHHSSPFHTLNRKTPHKMEQNLSRCSH